jgi:hypothetical protein
LAAWRPVRSGVVMARFPAVVSEPVPETFTRSSPARTTSRNPSMRTLFSPRDTVAASRTRRPSRGELWTAGVVLREFEIESEEAERVAVPPFWLKPRMFGAWRLRVWNERDPTWPVP